MRHSLQKAAAVAFLVFLVIWVGQTIYALTQPYPPPAPVWTESAGSFKLDNRSQQVANNLKQIGLMETPLPLVLEQAGVERIRVFERNARLTSGTAAFDTDESKIRSALTDYQADIFTEKNLGIAPARRLTLEIGVNPEKFEALVEQLRKIADLESIAREQEDRTSEFRRLHAQQQSLKKYQEAVLKLRGANNITIDESLKLEQKIQEIDKELQTVGGQLGDLLGKESYYHVFLTLREYQPGGKFDPTNTVPQRLLQAFFWSVGWWLTAAALVAIAVTGVVSVRTLWPHSRTRGMDSPQVSPAT